MAKAKEVPSKGPGEIRNGAISLAHLLETGEVLTGTPTVSATPSGLTFSNVAVNSTAITIDGVSVTAGEAIQFRVTGGSSGVLYTCTATCSTNSTPAQTVDVVFKLLVSAGG
jgi:hypothetical protein